MADTDDLDAQLLAQMREDFLIEAQEIFERLEPLLAELERESDPDVLNSLFRDVHTLKGTAGFVGLTTFQTLAHKLEDIFGALRAGTTAPSSRDATRPALEVTPALIDLAFEGVRMLASMREDVARGGSGDMDITPLMERLNMALQNPRQFPASSAETSEDRTEDNAGDTSSSLQPSVEELSATETSTLRVRVETLDRLIMLVGELITARNALQANAARLQDPVLLDNATVIGRLVRQLQTEITSMRLIPIARLFARFTGVVRTLAREHGKAVNLVTEGGDTPIDRTVYEQMYDPLVHLLRNAIDHGIELPEERREMGKPAEARICISAERRGDTVIIRVADDGRGINPDHVRQIAVERDLLSQGEAEGMSNEQMIRMVFRSGFSTKTEVTDISGRGVGLDVVMEHVRQLRGSVDIETSDGEGTTFMIQLPLTLAILQVLLARVGERLYALPLHTVRETLQIKRHAIQTMQQGQVLSLREEVLPVYALKDLLHVEATGSEENNGSPDAQLPPEQAMEHAVVVHLASGNEIWIVDELMGKQQVVVQTLPSYLGTVRGVEGAAILPDGSVTLILDLEGLAWE